MKEAVP